MCCMNEQVQQLQQAKPAPPECRSISVADVHKVHCAVEHCLLRRCTVDETVAALEAAGLAPAVFTRLVWKQLEKQNPSFFQAYYKALAARKQPKQLMVSAARAA